MDKIKVARINALAKKAKSEGLTADEKLEQEKLRKEYIDEYKSNLRSQLDNTYIVDKNGNKRKLRSKNKEDK